MSQRKRTGSTIVLVLGVLAACRPVPPLAREAAALVGVRADFQTVNELISLGSAFNDTIVDQLFLQLLEENPDFASGPPTFAPRLAASWQSSPDGRVLEMQLRRDVSWSDGQPVTADDVAFSFAAQTDPQVAWDYAYLKAGIGRLEVVDPHTVRFHFAAPSASQLADVNEGVILPAHAWRALPFAQWRERPDWFTEHLVTAGPFLLSSWRRGEQIDLVRNPRYYEAGLPGFDRITFRIVADESNLVEQLVRGDLDLIEMPGPTHLARLRSEAALQIHQYRNRQYTFVTWNLARPQLRDRRVRQALALASNRQALVDTLLAGAGQVGCSPVVSWIWPGNGELAPWPYDPDRARALLEESGFRDHDGDGVRERDGVALRFELSTNPGSELRWNALQMLQNQWREVGIDARPQLVEYNQLNARNQAHDYDATLMALLMDTNLDFSSLAHSRSIDGGFNFGGFHHPEADRSIDAANAVSDKRWAEQPLLDLQRILHEEQPFLFLWEPNGLVAARRSLAEVEPNAISAFANLRHWRRRATSPG